MFVSEIHLWGAAVVACVVFVAMIALAFFYRKMLRRMLVIFGATVAQMTVVVAVVCLSVCVFGADGMHDCFAHADHDELPAQHATSRGSA